MTFNNRPTVLVVGDARFQAELGGMLALLSYRIVYSDPFQTERPDEPCCLVTDLETGLTVPSSGARANSMPAVFVTEGCELSACVRAMKTGAVDILEQPLDAESLIAAVDEAIARDRAARAREREMASLQNRYATLTPRERQVLPFITSGLLNKQTAAELGTTEITIRVHRGQIMRKMAAQSLPELVRIVDTLGLQGPRSRAVQYSSAA